jgi:Ca-activated chloride channel family protein
MTELAHPAALLLLVPVLLLPLQRWLLGGNTLAVGGLQAVQTRWSLRRVMAPLPMLLQVVGLALCVIALARPRETVRDVVVESEGLDIILAVDTSGSMQATDFVVGGRQVDRLSVAKGVMADFIEGRPNDRIGVVVFGEEAFTHVPLTLDHQTLQAVLEQVEIGVAGAQGTAIGSAIAVGAKRLKDLEAPDRLMIVLTDGRNNAGRIAPMEAAQASSALGIKVYTIGVGAASRSAFGMLRIGDGLDEEGLTAIAEATGGRYFRATDTRSLVDIYATIDELEPSPAEVTELVAHVERYRWFLLPGTALLAVQLLLSRTWLRRGP